MFEHYAKGQASRKKDLVATAACYHSLWAPVAVTHHQMFGKLSKSWTRRNRRTGFDGGVNGGPQLGQGFPPTAARLRHLQHATRRGAPGTVLFQVTKVAEAADCAELSGALFQLPQHSVAHHTPCLVSCNCSWIRGRCVAHRWASMQHSKIPAQ